MATVNTNAISYGLVNGQGFLQVEAKINNASFPFHQGDLVFLSSGIAKPVTADGDAATLIGVALQPTTVSSSIDNGLAPVEKTVQVGYAVAANMLTTAAETYTDGIAVYVGVDAQTITTVSGSNPVGKIKLPPAVSSVTGATGVRVPMVVFSHAFGTFA